MGRKFLLAIILGAFVCLAIGIIWTVRLDVPSPQPFVASIGPVTSKTALERGLRVDVEASEHTIDGLVDALLGALSSGGA